MKKNISYIIALVAMLAIAVFIIWDNQQAAKTPWEKDFKVENPERINKIFMADTRGETITLEQQDGQWLVNGKYTAKPYLLDNLLTTLESLQINSPVPEPAYDNVVKMIVGEHVKVELYKGKEKEPFKVFFVGPEATTSNGSYLLMRKDGQNANNPYIVSVPGHVGGITPRFQTDETTWRDLTVFSMDMEDIASVSVNYKNQPNDSFTMKVLDEDSVAITPVSEWQTNGDYRLYKTGVNQFLASFEQLNAEAFKNEYSKKDSIMQEEPFAQITLAGKDGSKQQMKVWFMPVNKRTKLQFDAQGNPIEVDRDRYFALINDGEDFVIIQQFVFGKVFRRKAEFFEKAS